jgi:hypothetical protein
VWQVTGVLSSSCSLGRPYYCHHIAIERADGGAAAETGKDIWYQLHCTEQQSGDLRQQFEGFGAGEVESRFYDA